MESRAARLFKSLILTLMLFFSCNLFFFARYGGTGILLTAAGILFLVLFAVFPVGGKSPFRLKALYGGCVQLVLGACCWAAEAVFCVWAACSGRFEGKALLINGLIAFLLLSLLMGEGFWRVMATSRQAGVLLRAAALLTWWIPVVNLFTVGKLCRRARLEYMAETEKLLLNAVRAESAVCKTKYPILMVHGVFFRDWQFFNYWGRVPRELRRNGAEIFYGDQQSAAGVADSAAELLQKIEAVVRETGCGKLNLIAHSKGGLDSRYAISKLGAAPYVASLTTVNTPHKGCLWAQTLLEKLPASLTACWAKWYNGIFRKLGDKNPDFLRAANCLTASFCAKLDAEMPDREGIVYRSVMTKMSGPLSGRFPLNLTYLLVKRYDGENDGLVGVGSAVHGSFLGTVASRDRRGISHGDVIDLYRENWRGFDVREFYVQLVKDLKEKGL